MSAPACIAFYGIRYLIRDEEIAQLEERTHPLMQAARVAKAAVYWGDFDESLYYLFVGAKLGILGPENAAEVQWTADDLSKTISETESKLVAFEGERRLYSQWQHDV